MIRYNLSGTKPCIIYLQNVCMSYKMYICWNYFDFYHRYYSKAGARWSAYAVKEAKTYQN